MEMLVQELISKFFNNDPVSAFIVSVIFFLTVWLYKEFRNNMNENERERIERIDKALDLYGELEQKIISYQRKEASLSELQSLIGKVYAYVPRKHLAQLQRWCEANDSSLLKKCLDDLRNEITRLKLYQRDFTSYIPEDSFDTIAEFIHKYKLRTLVFPFFHSILALLTILLLVSLCTLLITGAWTLKVFIMFSVFNGTIGIGMLVKIIELLCDKTYSNILSYTSVLLIITVCTTSRLWWLAIVCTCFIIVYLYKLSSERSNDEVSA